MTKHVFNGSSRLLTKHSGGSIVFRSKPRNTRSYKGRPESKIPGNYKAESHPNKKTDAVSPPPLAGVKGKSAQAPGQQKKPEQAQNGNGKGKGQQGANGNSKAKTNGNAGTAGLNGIAHRSDRANEVAQNTSKNPHLAGLGLGDGDNGDGSEGSDGGDSGEDPYPGQCETINAGCTAGEEEEALYTGDEIVIIGDTKEQQFYYHPDHLGSTAYITDGSGQLTEHLEYFPFGETWVQEGGSKKTPYLYTGKELDQETGLYYYGARYYDPRVSMWASPDPILEKYLPTFDYEEGRQSVGKANGVFVSQNLSLYVYAHQNPIRLKDPDGNYVESAIDVMSLAVGIASFGDNISEGNYWSAGLDAVGIVLDGAALALPVVPGGVGLAVKAGRGLNAADNGLSTFKQAAKYGIQKYDDLMKAKKGTGLEAHHLIEKRFADVLGEKAGDMMSIALTKDEHRTFTNAWRQAIPYGEGTANASKDQIMGAAKEIYKDYPDILDALDL